MDKLTFFKSSDGSGHGLINAYTEGGEKNPFSMDLYDEFSLDIRNQEASEILIINNGFINAVKLTLKNLFNNVSDLQFIEIFISNRYKNISIEHSFQNVKVTITAIKKRREKISTKKTRCI